MLEGPDGYGTNVMAFLVEQARLVPMRKQRRLQLQVYGSGPRLQQAQLFGLHRRGY